MRMWASVPMLKAKRPEMRRKKTVRKLPQQTLKKVLQIKMLPRQKVKQKAKCVSAKSSANPPRLGIMNDLGNVYGVHAVEALLRHHPKRVKQLLFADGRSEPRMQVLRDLAAAERIQISAVSRRELDEQIDGVHQGVVAKVSPSQI